MKLARIPLAAFFAVLVATSVAAADYFPPRGSWDRKTPAELGVDAARLKEAIDYAVANENPSSPRSRSTTCAPTRTLPPAA